MGKTERNGVDPQDLIDQYGADTARLFVMFVGGPEDASVWSDTGVGGSARFLRRLWQFAARQGDTVRRARDDVADLGAAAKALRREVHALLKQVSYDYERMQYNTVVSGAMKLLNALEDFKPDAGSAGDAAVLREGLSVLLRVLYPACPHITQVLWQQLGFAASGSVSCSTRRCPRSTNPRWCKTRSSSCCRSTARRAAAFASARRPTRRRSSARHWPAPSSPSSAKASPPRRW